MSHFWVAKAAYWLPQVLIQTLNKRAYKMSESCVGHLQVNCHHSDTWKSIFPDVVVVLDGQRTHSPDLLASYKQAFTSVLLCVPSTGGLQQISQHDKWGRQSGAGLHPKPQPCLQYWWGHLWQRVPVVCPQPVSTACVHLSSEGRVLSAPGSRSSEYQDFYQGLFCKVLGLWPSYFPGNQILVFLCG